MKKVSIDTYEIFEKTDCRSSLCVYSKFAKTKLLVWNGVDVEFKDLLNKNLIKTEAEVMYHPAAAADAAKKLTKAAKICSSAVLLDCYLPSFFFLNKYWFIYA